MSGSTSTNKRAERVIKPFAADFKKWLFANTGNSAKSSAILYSIIEMAKAKGFEPSSYFQYLIGHIVDADTLEKLETLLSWNRSKAM